jgi:DNA-binding beta-propeller fold protein YncE
LLGVFCIALAAGPLAAQTPPNAFVNFEGAQTNPIRISADGTRLFAVNTPNGTLSVFDLSKPTSPALIAEIPVGIEPVSVNINPSVPGNDEAWVTNQISNSVSIVSVSKGIVTDTLYAKAEPADVVFAKGSAFVSVARTNMVNVYNAATHALTKSIALTGEEPRALAVSPSGTTVYAAFALSGNHSTIVPNTAKGLPQNQTPWPADMNPLFTTPNNLPPTVGLIADASDPTWSGVIKYTMPDNDVAAIDASSFSVSYYSHLGTDNLGLAVNPVSGNLYVANMDALNLVNFQNVLNGHDVNNQITTVNVSNGQSQMFDLNPGLDYGQLPNPTAIATALAMPTGVIFEPTGRYLYIAAFGTDRVGIFDTTTNTVSSFIEINPQAIGTAINPASKRGPRGLALSSSSNTLYVLNRISNTISVLNLSKSSIVAEIGTGSFDPTPMAIRNGRGFLYDAKLSGNGTNSCASCHIDAEMDLLAWNLGNPPGGYTYLYQTGAGKPLFTFHPMKGPMTTQSLRGLANIEPYHWRGDKPDLAAFNGAFAELMGGTELSIADMGAFTNFINTIVYQPNPNENLDGTLPNSIALPDHPGVSADPNIGYTTFTTVQFGLGQSDATQTCNFCHTAPASIPGYAPGTNLQVRTPFGGGVGADQPLKVPHLRNMYWKTNANFNTGAVSVNGFGYGHEGNIAGLANQADQGSFGVFSTRVNPNKPQAAQYDQQVEAYELCFDTGTPPATGYARTLTATTVGTSGAQSDWTTLQNLATAGTVDLIANGTVQGKVTALLYQPTTGTYISSTSGGPYTPSQLTTFINNGDILTIMGVPFGSGSRMVNTKLVNFKNGRNVTHR